MPHASIGVRQAKISPQEAGQRLDNYLLRVLKGLPRTRIYRIIRRGEVRVNRGRVKPDYRLAAGDVIRIPPVRLEARRSPRVVAGETARLSGRVIFEDKTLLILDKPAGMAVHGGSGLSYGVIEMLRAARPEAPYLELVHRLDRATSGCLMIAKRRSRLRELHRQLREGVVKKTYLALVAGDFGHSDRDCDAPLDVQRRSGGERTVAVSAGGRPSLTRFRPLRRVGDCTLVEARPETGRTHQIRVHAAHLGHPIAGDARYGVNEVNQRLVSGIPKRLFLHALSLELEHPAGERLRVEAPVDEEWSAALSRLGSISE